MSCHTCSNLDQCASKKVGKKHLVDNAPHPGCTPPSTDHLALKTNHPTLKPACGDFAPWGWKTTPFISCLLFLLFLPFRFRYRLESVVPNGGGRNVDLFLFNDLWYSHRRWCGGRYSVAITPLFLLARLIQCYRSYVAGMIDLLQF